MSGTSADGIDLALVDFSEQQHNLVASYYQPYDHTLRQQITSLYVPSTDEIDRMGHLDKHLASLFSKAILQFLEHQNLTADDIIAIGNHGQTIRHRPKGKHPYTLQVGCNQTLACLTGIRVIGKFRDKDIALGGQGAPLVPAYHQAMFSDPEKDVCVVNIGGISNITFLPKETRRNSYPVCGYDTGPGNALLDDWYRLHHQECSQGIDFDSQWAQTGQCNDDLLDALYNDLYFSLPAPKSTGREYFHLSWLQDHKQSMSAEILAEDVQATLLRLTCQSIAEAINQLSNRAEVIICGGGANNPYLMAQLTQLLPNHDVDSLVNKDVDNDSLEALIFAWLAYAYDNNICGNLPMVTGAKKATVLGQLYTP